MGSPERVGSPGAWLIWWQRPDSKPRSPHSPSSALSCAVMEGATDQTGSQRCLQGQFLLEGRTSSSGLHGWGEGQSSRTREMVRFQGGVACGLCSSSWRFLDSPAPGETPWKPSSWDWRSKNQGLNAPGSWLQKGGALHSYPALHAKCHVESFPCTNSFSLCKNPARQIFLTALYLWGNWGSELGKEWTQITQLWRMELALW